MLDNTFGGADTGIDRAAVVVAKVYDDNKKALGMIYETALNIDNQASTVTWIMTLEGEIIHVNNSLGWSDNATRKAFEKTVGRQYQKTDQCNDRADLLTLEAILTAKAAINK